MWHTSTCDPLCHYSKRGLAIEVQDGLSSEQASGSAGSGYIPFNIIDTVVRNGKTETTESQRNIYMDYKILF